jgi:hypothetical protein
LLLHVIVVEDVAAVWAVPTASTFFKKAAGISNIGVITHNNRENNPSRDFI